MTDCQPEPELIGFAEPVDRARRQARESPHRPFSYRPRMVSRMANDHNTSIVWDSKLGTDRDADAALLSALSKEGFEAFLDKD